MTAYTVALFIHLLGVIALFGAFVLLQRAGPRLRGAQTVEQARTWVELARTTTPMIVSGAVMLLVTGMFMIGTTWGTLTPWAAVALAGLAMMATLHVLVNRHHFALVSAAVTAAPAGPPPASLARLISAPAPWAILFANNGMALASLWLMATKPDWLGAIVPMLALALVGGAVGYAVVRPRSAPSAAVPGSGAQA
jgi:hypothetical protein